MTDITEIQTLSYNASVGVEIRRYEEFSGVKVTMPEMLHHWTNRLHGLKGQPEQWLVPNDVLSKKATKSHKKILERAEQIKQHGHQVLTPGFIASYKAGETFRHIDYEDMVEDIDVLDLNEDQLSRIYQFSGYDHWVRRNGELVHRDVQIEAWPTYYGKPEVIEEQARRDPRFVSIDVEDNPVYQNHDISGLWNVWVRFALSPEELATFQSKCSTMGRIYLLEELVGLKRIDT